MNALVIILAVVTGWTFGPMRLRRRRRIAIRENEPLEVIDCAMAADLLQAALCAGSSIPGALAALDRALQEEREATGLDTAARMLMMGGRWEEAWHGVPARFDSLKDALQPAWEDGAAPIPLLLRGAELTRQGRQRHAREAAARLGSQLVMPLGLCFLPAFVLIGIVPVIAAAGISIFG